MTDNINRILALIDQAEAETPAHQDVELGFQERRDWRFVIDHLRHVKVRLTTMQTRAGYSAKAMAVERARRDKTPLPIWRGGTL